MHGPVNVKRKTCVNLPSGFDPGPSDYQSASTCSQIYSYPLSVLVLPSVSCWVAVPVRQRSVLGHVACHVVGPLLLSIAYKKQKSKRSEPEDNQVRHLLLCFVRSQRRNAKMHRIPTHTTNNSFKTKDMSLRKKLAVECIQPHTRDNLHSLRRLVLSCDLKACSSRAVSVAATVLLPKRNVRLYMAVCARSTRLSLDDCFW
jgi:hypothetical protein